jgi:hypothetical protein
MNFQTFTEMAFAFARPPASRLRVTADRVLADSSGLRRRVAGVARGTHEGDATARSAMG